MSPRSTVALPLRWSILLVGWGGLAAGAAAGRAPGSELPWIAVAAVSIGVAAALLAKPVERLGAALGAAARGDLAAPLPAGGAAEVRAGARDVAALRDALAAARRELAQGAARLGAESGVLAEGLGRHAAVAARQAAAVAETSATAAEIAQTAKAAAVHADEVIEVAQRSEDLSAEGRAVLERAVETIRGLAEQVQALSAAIGESAQRSRDIGEIVAGLREVAEQANLLAMNASIEAVNAGERGRGFSVVATEMANLAEQSKAAAGEVRGILVDVEAATHGALAVAEEGGRRAQGAMALAADAARALEGLTQAIRDSSLAARQIANNTRQQGIGVEQIVGALADISAASREVAEGSGAAERATASLTELAAALGSASQGIRGREDGA